MVATQTGLAAQPAETAAEGEAGDAGVADEPARDGQPVFLAGGVELGPSRAAAARGPLRARVDRNLVHRPDVDHHCAVGDAAACEVVASASDGELAAAVPGELDGGDDVFVR